jgi:hypothetical protein
MHEQMLIKISQIQHPTLLDAEKLHIAYYFESSSDLTPFLNLISHQQAGGSPYLNEVGITLLFLETLKIVF